MKEFLKWSDIRIGTWNSNPFTWDDVALIEEIEVVGGGNLDSSLAYVNKLPKKRKLQLIKIILTLQNKEFIETKYKNSKHIKINIDDIKLLLENKPKVTAIVKLKPKD